MRSPTLTLPLALTFCALSFIGIAFGAADSSNIPTPINNNSASFVDAATFGFSPDASGIANTEALQKAVDQTGTIIVSNPGIYKIAGTVSIGSNTSLIFGNNIFLKKVSEKGPFSHVIINKGAWTRTYDNNITIDGLHIIVNNVDQSASSIVGLRGQLAFFYVKDLRVNRFRCLDLGKGQFGLQICTFEDVIVDDLIIKGDKDGLHFGRGKRFTVRNGVFQTFDDAIALNAYDYVSSNPEVGWIEDGVVENCRDLDAETTTGFFCRILAGAWVDWKSGMEVRASDTIVSNGRLYRVNGRADGHYYSSVTQPTHESGSKVLDGINWVAIQNDVTYTAGVRNVVFRDIFLEKPRVAFAIPFDADKICRAYYPGAQIPKQENLKFDNIVFRYNRAMPFMTIGAPLDCVTVCNSEINNNKIEFTSDVLSDYQKTTINIYGCTFKFNGPMDLLVNRVDKKEILFKTFSNIELGGNFSAKVDKGNGKITVESDLSGLKK